MEDAMSDLNAQFEAAKAAVEQLPSRPGNETLLQLYALYKQATAGDVAGKRPGMLDMVGRAKHDAWEKLKGTSRDSAMQSYIDLVGRLQKK
jgi:diazepam-binding inhibitor (GABA receptor modulator, acyl-CoA-binding protein)